MNQEHVVYFAQGHSSSDDVALPREGRTDDEGRDYDNVVFEIFIRLGANLKNVLAYSPHSLVLATPNIRFPTRTATHPATQGCQTITPLTHLILISLTLWSLLRQAYC